MDPSPAGPAAPEKTGPSKLQMRGLRRWLACVCSVVFDLELGPKLEYMYPPDSLLADEQQSVCALSLPDSHSSALGDMSFSFRLRTQHSRCPKGSYFLTEQAFLFGFVHFRQQRDDTNSRGFLQKAVVVVTTLPCARFWEHVAQVVGRHYHEFGPVAAEAAVCEIAHWPPPLPGAHLEMALFGKLVSCRIPRFEAPAGYVEDFSSFDYSGPFSGSRSPSPVSSPAHQSFFPSSSPAPGMQGMDNSLQAEPKTAGGSPSKCSDMEQEQEGEGGAQAAGADTAGEQEPSQGKEVLMSVVIGMEELEAQQGSQQEPPPTEHSANSTQAAAQPTAAHQQQHLQQQDSPQQRQTHCHEASCEPSHQQPNRQTQEQQQQQTKDNISPDVVRVHLSSRKDSDSSTHSHPSTSTASQPASSSSASSSSSAHAPPSLPSSQKFVSSPTCPLSALAASLQRSWRQQLDPANGFFQDSNLFKPFEAVVSCLWFLWELLITGEPLLMIGSTASHCCDAVLALVGCMSPLPCRADYRPYFTIYDQDFKAFAAVHDSNPAGLRGLVIGATNPFFLKSLCQFPHVLTLGSDPKLRSRARQTSLLRKARKGAGVKPYYSRFSSPNYSASSGRRTSSPAPHGKSKSKVKSAAGRDGVLAISKQSKDAGAGFVTSRSPTLTTPPELLSRLFEPKLLHHARWRPSVMRNASSPRFVQKSGKERLSGQATDTTIDERDEDRDALNDSVLRQGVQQLTQAFLEPLGQYLQIVAEEKSQGEVWYHGSDGDTFRLHRGQPWNPYLQVPHLRAFTEEAFLAQVHNYTPAQLKQFGLTGHNTAAKREQLVDLYRRFFRALHFRPWFSALQEQANCQIQYATDMELFRLAQQDGQPLRVLLAAQSADRMLEMWRRARDLLAQLRPPAAPGVEDPSGAMQQSPQLAGVGGGGSRLTPRRGKSSACVVQERQHVDSLRKALQLHIEIIKSCLPGHTRVPSFPRNGPVLEHGHKKRTSDDRIAKRRSDPSVNSGLAVAPVMPVFDNHFK
eukprot:g38034.t1